MTGEFRAPPTRSLNSTSKVRAAYITFGTGESLNPCIDVQNLALDLLIALLSHRASRLLRSSGNGRNLFGDLSRLNSAVNSNEFDPDRIKTLLYTALVDHPDDVIWGRVYEAVTESTPPPRPIASSLQQTPWLRNTGSFANSSEHRQYIDHVLREELGSLYAGLGDFHETYFGSVPHLAAISKTFFDDCLGGSSHWCNHDSKIECSPLAMPSELTARRPCTDDLRPTPLAGDQGKFVVGQEHLLDDPCLSK